MSQKSGTPKSSSERIVKTFAEMPGCMGLRPAFAKIGRYIGSKMVHLAAHRLIGNHDSAFC